MADVDDFISGLIAERDTLRSQLSIALQEKNEDLLWWPMELLPVKCKDGRKILVHTKTGDILVAHYMRGGHCIEDHPPIEAGWYYRRGTMNDLVHNPVQYMLFPSPPQR